MATLVDPADRKAVGDFADARGASRRPCSATPRWRCPAAAPTRARQAAKHLPAKYLTPSLPLHADDLSEHTGSREAAAHAMIQSVVERMYTESEENRFLEVTYANGYKEVLYFKDFNSGAMIQNIVDRAKKMAIKAFPRTPAEGSARLPPPPGLRG
ncbi:Proteasome-associated ATPase [Streptomyces cyaneofuscatus]